jgi:hypothetical protein
MSQPRSHSKLSISLLLVFFTLIISASAVNEHRDQWEMQYGRQHILKTRILRTEVPFFFMITDAYNVRDLQELHSPYVVHFQPNIY